MSPEKKNSFSLMFLDVIVSIAACSVFMVNTFGEETEVNTEIIKKKKKCRMPCFQKPFACSSSTD